jgi:hypothetical protein
MEFVMDLNKGLKVKATLEDNTSLRIKSLEAHFKKF